jgi:hypothetical protein
LQKQDATFIHRNYDIGKILKHPEEFVADVGDKLSEIHGIFPDRASSIAHGLHNKLVNGSNSGKFSRAAAERGAVHGRNFDYSTDVVRDWLVRDINENIAAVANSIVPDYHLMVEIRTFDGESFRSALLAIFVELLPNHYIPTLYRILPPRFSAAFMTAKNQR